MEKPIKNRFEWKQNKTKKKFEKIKRGKEKRQNETNKNK